MPSFATVHRDPMNRSQGPYERTRQPIAWGRSRIFANGAPPLRGITRRQRGGKNSPQLFQRRPAQLEQFVRTICPRYLSVLRRVAPPLAVPNDRTVRKCSRSGVTSLHTQPHVTARTAAARVTSLHTSKATVPDIAWNDGAVAERSALCRTLRAARRDSN